MFLSRFFAIVTRKDCNCKSEVVIFIYILWHAVNKLSIFCNVRILYLIKRRLNKYFFQVFLLQLKIEQMTTFTSCNTTVEDIIVYNLEDNLLKLCKENVKNFF